MVDDDMIVSLFIAYIYAPNTPPPPLVVAVLFSLCLLGGLQEHTMVCACVNGGYKMCYSRLLGVSKPPIAVQRTSSLS